MTFIAATDGQVECVVDPDECSVVALAQFMNVKIDRNWGICGVSVCKLTAPDGYAFRSSFWCNHAYPATWQAALRCLHMLRKV